jgi:hypothetical protein
MFGLFQAVPAAVANAWGARLIYPDDLLHDRQGMTGGEEGRPELIAWLNGGAIRAALANARKFDNAYKLSRDGAQQVVLHRDELGVIVACPNKSHGYLYVAGWLHQGEEDKQPAADFTAPEITPDPWTSYTADDDDDEDYDD